MDMSADSYGRHSQANARGLPVKALLERLVASGDAICLAWRDDQLQTSTDRAEFPTAVLPVVRELHQQDANPDDEETEPTTATRGARRWLSTNGFSWWPKSLAG
jgi:hypothetical protein